MKDKQLLALVDRARKKDRAAFVKLCEMKAEEVIFLCVREMGNRQDGEDAAQEVFIRMQKSIDKLRAPEALNVWLNRLVYYTCSDMRKKKMREKTVSYDEPFLDELYDESNDGLPQSFIEQEDKRQRMIELIDDLPEKYRSCILMHYYQHMSYADIAEVLGIKENAVDNNLRMARKVLRQQLQDEETDYKQLASVPVVAFGAGMSQLLSQVARQTVTAAVKKACMAAAGVYQAFSAASGGAAAFGSFITKPIVQGGVALLLAASIGGSLMYATGNLPFGAPPTSVVSQDSGEGAMLEAIAPTEEAEENILAGQIAPLQAEESTEMAGVWLELVRATGEEEVVAQIQTEEDGSFSFEGIAPGWYRLRVYLPAGALLPGEEAKSRR